MRHLHLRRLPAGRFAALWALAACYTGTPGDHAGATSASGAASLTDGTGAPVDTAGPSTAGTGSGTEDTDGSGRTTSDEPMACGTTPDVATTPLLRLTRDEYTRSVRDLVGVTLPGEADLPADEALGPFAVNAVASVTALTVEQYLGSAEVIAKAAVADDNRLTDLIACDRKGLGDTACADAFIARIGRRAFRRPLTTAEQAAYLKLYETYAQSGGFANGIRLVVEALLVSPHFLYRPDYTAEAAAPGQGSATAQVLSSYAIAGRLASFLWKSVPDDDLLDAAERGALADPTLLEAQANRMLDDPRAREPQGAFFTRWLATDSLAFAVKDPALHPDFTPELRSALRDETERFAQHVLFEDDARLETLFSAAFSILDEPLFDYYGVSRPPGTTGPVRVPLDPTQRSGLLTQGSFLAAHAHANQTSPVGRGVTILRNVMCVALPDPPPDVNATPPDPDPNKTLREQLAEHQDNAACRSCHAQIDGIGLGFESYDAIGAFREGIDSTGKIAKGSAQGPFDGAIELSAKLAQSDEVKACVARQWFRYALGRTDAEADRCAMEAIANDFAASDYDLRRLILSIATSDAFRYRRIEAP